MDHNDRSTPPDPVTPPAARGRNGPRLRVARPRPDGILQWTRAFSVEVLRRETPNITCEIVKEDLTARAQARKFLWEFFD